VLHASVRPGLFSGAPATLMLGAWPEPFGLVAIESMATGTPVIARRAGGVTETVEHGVSGYLVDDVSEAVMAVSRVSDLRRDEIAAYARGRFSAKRMTSLYERAYASLIDERGGGRPRPTEADRTERPERPPIVAEGFHAELLDRLPADREREEQPVAVSSREAGG
jgi:hypothetical protein